MELHHLREELLQPFSPDEGIAGLDVQLNKAHSWTSAQFQRNVSFDEVTQDLPGCTYHFFMLLNKFIYNVQLAILLSSNVLFPEVFT